MNKVLKRALVLIVVVLLFSTFCINAFAASASYKVVARNYSQELVDVTCNYYSLLKDSFTVKNNGTITMIVHRNRCLVATLAPGQSYTCPKTHNFKDRVQVFAKKPGSGYQKISITSTSGKIYYT